jgi:hypothetical protein
MHVRKWVFLIINIIGGIAVLGSYILGFTGKANAGVILWGGVPQEIRPFYTAGMLLATAGYFAFSYFIFFRLDADHTCIADRFGFSAFNILYSAILFPSALWLPFTFLAAESSSPLWLWLVRLVLWIVGAGSLVLLIALWKVRPRQPRWAHSLAILGSLAFCLQTALLDAIVWVIYFQI